MAKVKIMVVEDEMVVSMMICDILEELGYDVLDPITNYESAVECLNRDMPDIALLDIDLASEKNGIDLAYYIKENINIPFIFLTSKSDPRTIEQAKKLNPPAYLVKPFKQEDLYTSIELALYNFQPALHSQKKENFQNTIIKNAFFVKGTNLFHKVKFSEITYAKSDHVYVELYTLEGRRHLLRSSISNFTESLPDNFFRVHRSYTINLDHLESINNLYVIIKGQRIPIGKMYRDQLMQLIDIK